MLKKTLLGLAAAAAITTAALAPSTASAGKIKIGVHLGLHGHGYVGIHAPYYAPYGFYGYRKCFYRWRKVWTPYGPKFIKFRKCRRVWY